LQQVSFTFTRLKASAARLIAYSTYTDADLFRSLARDDSHAFETQYARHCLVIQSLPAYLKSAVKFKIANHIRDGRIRQGFFEDLAGFHPASILIF